MPVHRERTCACGHAESFHTDGKGACFYGIHTVTGGCVCPDFHRRRRPDALPSEAPAPQPDLVTLATAIDAAIHTLQTVRGILEREQPNALTMMLSGMRGVRAVEKRPVTNGAAKPRSNGVAHASNGMLAGGERKILTVLAQYPEGRSKVQVAILTGYAHSGGGFSNYISALRMKGCLDGDRARLWITDAGRTTLGKFEPLPTGRALLEYWKENAGGKAERRILEVLASDSPYPISKIDLARRTDYEPSGGGFNNALSRLRTLELIQGSKDLRLSETLRS